MTKTVPPIMWHGIHFYSYPAYMKGLGLSDKCEFVAMRLFLLEDEGLLKRDSLAFCDSHQSPQAKHE